MTREIIMTIIWDMAVFRLAAALWAACNFLLHGVVILSRVGVCSVVSVYQ